MEGLLKILAKEDDEGNIVSLVTKGELIAFIGQGEIENSIKAWLVVSEEITIPYTKESKYGHYDMILNENDNSLLISSNNPLLILGSSTKSIGRIGFHTLDILQCWPHSCFLTSEQIKEVHVGEYEIKQAFQKYPGLVVYARLIDTYPKPAE